MALRNVARNITQLRFPTPSSIHQIRPHNNMILIPSSTTIRYSSSFSPMTWLQNRQERNNAESYKKQITKMSESAGWTLSDMNAGFDEATNSWSAKIPGLNNTKELELAKEMQGIITGLIHVAGPDATVDRVEAMSRHDKLRAALAGKTSVERINGLVAQFKTMSLMQRVLSVRKQEGKPIPNTPEAVEAMIQAEAPKLLNKKERRKLGEAATRSLMRKGRRR